MPATIDPPPPQSSPSTQKRQRLTRDKGEQAASKFPLPGAGEQRYHLTRQALRFALYGEAPIAERTLERVRERFGLDRATLEKAWKEDGIEARQAELLGIKPIEQSISTIGVCVPMGSKEAGMAEGKEREKQLDLLRTRRATVTTSLESLPSRIEQLNSSLETCSPESTAQVSLAIDSANREAAKLVTDLRTLNSMIAEATGLDVIQSLSLAAAKAQAAKAQAAAPKEREIHGVVVDL